MSSDSIAAQKAVTVLRRRPQVIGNIEAPDGKLVVVRIEAEPADSSATAQEELGRFKINGTAYAVRRDERSVDGGATDFARILTAREMEIAALVAAGSGNKQIAARLRISEHTVSSYLNRIYSKLRVHNRSAVAAQYAAWASNLPRA